MKKINVPEFYVFGGHGFPIVCRNYVEALEMARKKSLMMEGYEFKVLDLYNGEIKYRYLNGKSMESHDKRQET